MRLKQRVDRASLRAASTILSATGAACLLCLGAAGSSSALRAHKSTIGTVHVIEHAVTDTVVHSGGSGDKTGNLLTFHNYVYNPSDTSRVGHDQGFCVRIFPTAGSWECMWTTFLPLGQITVEGP